MREVVPETESAVDVARAIRAANRHRLARPVAAAVVTALVVAVSVLAAAHQDVTPARPAGQLDVLRQSFTVGDGHDVLAGASRGGDQASWSHG